MIKKPEVLAACVMVVIRKPDGGILIDSHSRGGVRAPLPESVDVAEVLRSVDPTAVEIDAMATMLDGEPWEEPS